MLRQVYSGRLLQNKTNKTLKKSTKLYTKNDKKKPSNNYGITKEKEAWKRRRKTTKNNKMK